MSYVDLHCHLLPGLDDGARSLAATVEHARRLEAAGVRDVACTPHVKRASFPGVAPAELAGRRAEAQAAVTAAGLSVRLRPGGELAHPDALALSPRELRLLAQGPADAPWMLLETPFAGIDPEFLAAAARLTGLGYGLLIAHPERAKGFLHDGGLERAFPLLEAGALLQVNVCSLVGDNGLAAQEGARALVRRGLAFCLASDGHPGTRERTLRDGAEALTRMNVAPAQVDRLTQANPRFLLDSGIPQIGTPELALAA